jgi:hypothetical protein
VHPQGKRQTLAPEPQPDATYRSEFGETRKNGLDRGAHGFVRLEGHTPMSSLSIVARKVAFAGAIRSNSQHTSKSMLLFSHLNLNSANGAVA